MDSAGSVGEERGARAHIYIRHPKKGEKLGRDPGALRPSVRKEEEEEAPTRASAPQQVVSLTQCDAQQLKSHSDLL